MRRQARRWPVLVILIALLTAACSGGDGDSSTTTVAAAKKVKIAVLAPVSGPEAATGLGVRNAVDLAVRQANEDDKVEGFEVEIVVEDAGTPEQGTAIATELASDPALAGVIGPLSSDVAAAVAPVFAAEGVVVISPAATDPTLTRGPNLADAERPFGTFFRMATTNEYQGPFAADFAAGDLNAKRVATAGDGSAPGRMLVDGFSRTFVRGGGQVVVAETVSTDTAASAAVDRFVAENVDLVYYGGAPAIGARLATLAKTRGLRAPIMGANPLFSEAFIAAAGDGAEGTLVTAPGPLDTLDTTDAFAEAYAGEEFEEEPGPYGPLAFDAATILIDAVAEVVSGRDAINDALREQVLDLVQDANFDGATGTTTFDEFGDNTNRMLAVSRVQGGEWTAVIAEEVTQVPAT